MKQELENCLFFVIFISYQSVPIIITDQFNKNVRESLHSGTVYMKMFHSNNVKSHLWFYLETCLNPSLNYARFKKWISQKSFFVSSITTQQFNNHTSSSMTTL